MVVPQMAAMTERATVMLFVLNENPQSPTGRRFDALLADLIPGAWRVTCPQNPDCHRSASKTTGNDPKSQ